MLLPSPDIRPLARTSGR